MALPFLLHCAASRPMLPPPQSAYTSTTPDDLFRISQVRIAALVCSGVSTGASLLALYWFFRMEKKFRHYLILLLFYGGLTASVWYFVYTALTSIRGPLSSESATCQVSGFFIQYGTETCDYAVLVIAIHSAMQVFNPCPPATTDGLRPYRRYVYAGASLLPLLMSSLAFVDPRYRYQSLGAFCTLPIRPFWYRLALQWVPRYLIAIVIFCLAIAIYTYVALKFRSYHQVGHDVRESQKTSNMSSVRSERIPIAMVSPGAIETVETEPENLSSISSLAQGVVSSPRRESGMSSSSAGSIPIGAAFITPLAPHSVPEYVIPRPPRRPSLALIPSGYTIHQTSPPGHGHTLASIRPKTGARSGTCNTAGTSLSSSSTSSPPTDGDSGADFDPDSDPLSFPQTPVFLPQTPLFQSRPASPSHPGQRQMERQRARTHRQLRLLFIYPLVYTFMWLMPFVMHCMNYRELYALRPVWFVRMASTICMTSIGFVNFVVFTVREQPWRSIPTSDGTLWGSFVVWRSDARANGTRANSWASSGCGRPSIQGTASEDMEGRAGRLGARTSASQGVNSRTDVGLARVRLRLEREDRLEANMRRENQAREAAAMAAMAAMEEEGEEEEEDPSEREKNRQGKMVQRQGSRREKGKVRVVGQV